MASHIVTVKGQNTDHKMMKIRFQMDKYDSASEGQTCGLLHQGLLSGKLKICPPVLNFYFETVLGKTSNLGNIYFLTSDTNGFLTGQVVPRVLFTLLTF